MLCTNCYKFYVHPERLRIRYTTCFDCGEKEAAKKKHCVVPMHKSNYVLMTNVEDLKGINNKGGFYR